MSLLSVFKIDHTNSLSSYVTPKTVLIGSTGALAGLGILYLGKIWYSYGFFKKMGIKTPKYKFITGNLDEIDELNYTEALHKWTKELGSIYGYYEGHMPILVTSDMEFIQEVFFKQFFKNFSARKLLPLQSTDEHPFMNVVFTSRNRWKRQRIIMNPSFSNAKLKELVPIMKLCTDRLMARIDNNLGKEVDFSDWIGRHTMDAVFNCLFDFEMDLQNDPDNIYLTKVRTVVNQAVKMNLLNRFLTLFYEFKPLVIEIAGVLTNYQFSWNLTTGQPFFWLLNKVGEVIKNKVDSKVAKKDYLQIVLESHSEKVNNVIDKLSDVNIIEKKITTEEIVTNMVGFMIAAYETTNATLSNCMYTLATRPEELSKLQDEIDNNINSVDEINFDSVAKLEYLDCFVREVLRMYSITNVFLNRRCTNSTVVCGIPIPEDLTIEVDVQSIHFNPEYWGSVDPHEFYPLRFKDPNIHKLAWMPFGLGGRQCIGMKFGLLEIKLALTKLIREYNVEPSENTPNPDEYKKLFLEANAARKLRKNLKLVFTKRVALES